MPRPEGSYTKHGKTKLARLRNARDISLRVAAGLIRIPQSTLWRLEHGLIGNPRLNWLVNAAMLYDVPLTEVMEDEWLLGDLQPVARDQATSHWGKRASDVPPPVHRQPDAPVALTRDRSE
jgi:transcriptional regulator with XRE-family HTH domain